MIPIGERPLDLDDIRTALAGPIKVTLTAAARERIVRSAETVTRLLGLGDAIYGVNTGFGKLAKTRIAAQDLNALQINIVRSHAAGRGRTARSARRTPHPADEAQCAGARRLGHFAGRHGGAGGADQCRCAARHSGAGFRRRIGRSRAARPHEPRADRRGRGAGERRARLRFARVAGSRCRQSGARPQGRAGAAQWHAGLHRAGTRRTRRRRAQCGGGDRRRRHVGRCGDGIGHAVRPAHPQH